MKQSSRARTSMPIPLLTGILGIVAILIFYIIGIQKGTNPFEIIKLSLLAITLMVIIIFYLLSQHKNLLEMPFFDVILIGIHTASFLAIMLLKGRIEFPLWITGGLLIALLYDMYLGCMVAFEFVIIAAYIGNYSVEAVIYLLIVSILMCILSSYMKRLRMLGYTMVIVLSMQIILLFIINNFIIKDSADKNTLYSILSSIFSIVFSYIGYQIYNRKVLLHRNVQYKNLQNDKLQNSKLQNKKLKSKIFQNGQNITNFQMDTLSADNSFTELLKEVAITEEPQKEKKAIKTEDYEKNNDLEADETHSLDDILDLNFLLLQKLKKHSLKVYKHSVLIAELSSKAAKAIGADENKAKAGGLYHEIGRMENKQYVEEGIKLAKTYQLPGIVVDIIRQHNLKFEKPKTPEAAIVMIAISIIATKEYLEKMDDKVIDEKKSSPVNLEKIVNNVFQMRLSKGSLDESGLTLKQFNQLKDFFLQMQY